MRTVQQDFLQILSRYQGIIHKVNLIYFRNPADREDNFQEVVCQLWIAFPQLRDRSRLGSWVYAVAINTSISRLRKHKRTVLPDRIPEIPCPDESERIEQEINFGRLLEALRLLPEIDRSLMLLYLEEYSYEEIAGILGITRTNTGVRISRIKKELKRRLTD